MSESNTTVQSSQLEQYLLLAKTAKGRAAAELVLQVVEAPGVYVFGELLDMINIKELIDSPHHNHWELLNLFAYGTYTDYIANKDKYPLLTPGMINKLRHLTVVSLATKNKRIPYDTLLKALDMRQLRELEDLIIEVIYADVVRGKLDQRNNWLEVNYTIGRDIRMEDIGLAVKVLQDWCEGCESLLTAIEHQMSRANTAKRIAQDRRQHIESQQTLIRREQQQMMQQRENDMGDNDIGGAASAAVESSSSGDAKGGGGVVAPPSGASTAAAAASSSSPASSSSSTYASTSAAKSAKIGSTSSASHTQR